MECLATLTDMETLAVVAVLAPFRALGSTTTMTTARRWQRHQQQQPRWLRQQEHPEHLQQPQQQQKQPQQMQHLRQPQQFRARTLAGIRQEAVDRDRRRATAASTLAGSVMVSLSASAIGKDLISFASQPFGSPMRFGPRNRGRLCVRRVTRCGICVTSAGGCLGPGRQPGAGKANEPDHRRRA